CSQKRVQVGGQKLDVLTGAVFQNEGESSRRADTGNGRWREAECNSFGNLAELLIQTRLDLLKLFRPAPSLIPWLQSDKEEGVIGRARGAERPEPNDAGGGRNSRRVGQDPCDLPRDVVWAFRGGCAWQLQVHIHVPLSCIGRKPRRPFIAEEESRRFE